MVKVGILDKQINANPELPQAPTKNPPLNWFHAFLVCNSIIESEGIFSKVATP